MPAPLNVESILGPDGAIARRLAHYETRPQQLQMANAVADALAREKHLIAEAGTGTGKSYAYLIPAILHATADQRESEGPDAKAPAGERTRRVVISTHTISLQEQLIQKDIPVLNSVIPREFSAVLVKGRGNYLSRRRLANARAKAVGLLSDDQQIRQLSRIAAWAEDSHDGSLSTLPLRPDREVWDEVASETGNCLGRKCPTYQNCFYFQARRRAAGAQLLVVNHALFFSDLALRRQGVSLLPDYDAVVLDECHTVEAVAGDHLGIRLSSGQLDYLLNKLYNDRTQRGLLVAHDLRRLQQDVDRCRFAATELFADLLDWLEAAKIRNGRVKTPRIVRNGVSELLEELAGRLQHFGNGLESESDAKDFQAAHDRLLVLSGSLRSWIDQSVENAVYWIERSANRRGMDRVSLAAAPIDVGATLREELFQPGGGRNEEGPSRPRSVIMTSATLAVGSEPDFSFFRSRIGLAGGESLQVGSPFDYQQQAKLVVVRDLPDPASQRSEFEAALPRQIKRFVAHTDGHAFVLFTSYGMLRSCAAAMVPWLAERKMELYSQASDRSRTQLLEAFRENPRSVLFGTDSFWQGVDVPGDALQNVIITKLPFSVPDHPLLEARLERIREQGGNPFRDYQLPEAVIKMRQGVGRLIRTATDRGMVVILDPRVRTKPYGRVFLESLPSMPTHYVSVDPAASGSRARRP